MLRLCGMRRASRGDQGVTEQLAECGVLLATCNLLSLIKNLPWNTPRPSRSSFAPPPDTSLWLCHEVATIVGWTDRKAIVLSRPAVPAIAAEPGIPEDEPNQKSNKHSRNQRTSLCRIVSLRPPMRGATTDFSRECDLCASFVPGIAPIRNLKLFHGGSFHRIRRSPLAPSCAQGSHYIPHTESA